MSSFCVSWAQKQCQSQTGIMHAFDYQCVLSPFFFPEYICKVQKYIMFIVLLQRGYSSLLLLALPDL